jgi:hypothetical protein
MRSKGKPMTIMNVKVVPLSMFWEDQGGENIAYGSLLLSVSHADGTPVLGLKSSNFAFSLYNPFGQEITAIVTGAQTTAETQPGTYRLALQWDTPTAWGESNHLWQGLYAGDYSLALSAHTEATPKGGTASRGQGLVCFAVNKLPPGGF